MGVEATLTSFQEYFNMLTKTLHKFEKNLYKKFHNLQNILVKQSSDAIRVESSQQKNDFG